MDGREEIRHRLRLANLEARWELIEIQRTALLHEVTSTLTSEDRRMERIRQRDALSLPRAEILNELKAMQT
jgi:hypothetical protein